MQVRCHYQFFVPPFQALPTSSPRPLLIDSWIIIAEVFPVGCQTFSAFDLHPTFGICKSGALLASTMGLGPRDNQPFIRETFIHRIGRPQLLIWANAPAIPIDLRRRRKGVMQILKERNLWPENGRRSDGVGFLLQLSKDPNRTRCNSDPKGKSGCCARSLFAILYLYPATWSPKGYGSDLSLPLGADNLFLQYTLFRSPACACGGIVGCHNISFSPEPPEKALPEQREETKEREKICNVVWSPPSLLLRPLGSGLDLHLDLRVHLLSRLLLGGRGLVIGYLRSLSSLLPAWAGGGFPPPRKLAGLPLGGAGVGPRPMRALAVGTLGGHMRAPMTSSGLASLNGTLVVVCGVVLRAEGTPGGL